MNRERDAVARGNFNHNSVTDHGGDSIITS